MTRRLSIQDCPRTHRQRGVAAIEAALMLPILLLILWLGNDILTVIQQQSRLHRATAALPDVLANQSLEQGQRLPQRLTSQRASWLPLLTDMLRDQDKRSTLTERPPGLVITYLDSATLRNDTPTMQRHTIGSPCPSSDTPSLVRLAKDGLITSANVAQSELVLVESCWLLPQRFAHPRWILPQQLSSHFVAMRRQWPGK